MVDQGTVCAAGAICLYEGSCATAQVNEAVEHAFQSNGLFQPYLDPSAEQIRCLFTTTITNCTNVQLTFAR